METQIFKIDPEDIDYDLIGYCGRKLKEGKLVCFPTETVYGLGANSLDEGAVKRIFEAKGRPQDNPLIVHISNMQMLSQVSAAKDQERELLDKLSKQFWPGPLTLVTRKKPIIPSIVSCGLETVGIRMPASKISLALIGEANLPIAAPSANVSGKPSPTRAAHVIEDLMGKVDIIIDGGDCQVGLESSVLDITTWPPCILRPGAISQEELSHIVMDIASLERTGEIKEAKSPGLKYRHYSPKAKISLYKGDEKKVRKRILADFSKSLEEGYKPYILAFDETIAFYPNDYVLSLGPRDNSLEQASKLYAVLREFDHLGADLVLAELGEEKGLGKAIMDRLYRASDRVINV